MIDDIALLSIGRQFVELAIQREQLFRQLQEANKRIAELEAPKKDGD